MNNVVVTIIYMAAIEIILLLALVKVLEFGYKIEPQDEIYPQDEEAFLKTMWDIEEEWDIKLDDRFIKSRAGRKMWKRVRERRANG